LVKLQDASQENGRTSQNSVHRDVAVEIMILCLRPLPAMDGGWNSGKWRLPKLATPVAVRPALVAAWSAALPPEARAELAAILAAPFVAALRMEGPATAFDCALGYASVVAEACAGVVVLGDEIVADRRASVEVWSGADIEVRWRVIDAEAARAEPGYQPVRDAADDRRPTQTFPFPIRVDDVPLGVPDAAAHEQVTRPVAVPAAPVVPPHRRPTAERIAFHGETAGAPGDLDGERTLDTPSGADDDWSGVMPE
jgi:hypothetical protein